MARSVASLKQRIIEILNSPHKRRENFTMAQEMEQASFSSPPPDACARKLFDDGEGSQWSSSEYFSQSSAAQSPQVHEAQVPDQTMT